MSRVFPRDVPALEFLAGHTQRLRLRRLQLIPEHKAITLALPSKLHLPRTFRDAFPEISGEFEAFGRALQAASAQPLYGKRWRSASSSTVLI